MEFECPYHGDVEVLDKPLLWVYDPPDNSQEHFLEFFCYKCNDIIRFKIDAFNADALILFNLVTEKEWPEKDVPISHNHIPAELAKFREEIETID